MVSNRRTPRKTGPIVLSIVLVLTAMLLPVCHLHPLLDKGAPDHCTICVSLHAAAPMAAHAPSLAAPESLAEQIAPLAASVRASRPAGFSSSRAPPEQSI